MINNQAFNEAASIMSSQKLALKLTCDNITKRLRDIPETFEALKKVVKAQMCKGSSSQVQQLLLTDQFSITYEDDTGDTINVSDDEDLFSAYDVAENFLNRQLRLNIKPRERAQEKPIAAVNYPGLPDSKLNQKLQSQAPQEEINDHPMEEINSTYIKSAIHEVMNPDQPNREDDPSNSEDSEDDMPMPSNKEKGKGKAGGKKNKDFGGLPRKCFKKLIKKELDKQCQQIFNEMMVCRDIGGKNSNDDLSIVHKDVICDGCGMNPIQGVRYKCSVCKNLDYCSMCEERKTHDHPFLKIYKPHQCPKAMFTVIDENMQNAKPDIDVDFGENPFYRNHHRGGRGHHRGGRGHHWGGRGGHH
jgi:hypothetical protein